MNATKIAAITWSILLIILNISRIVGQYFGMGVTVLDGDFNKLDNFLVLGSFVGCLCGGNYLGSKYLISERMLFGPKVCGCANGTFDVWYRTCSLDEYLALRKCRKSPSPYLCIRIKELAEKENPCQSLTDVMQKEYCVNGTYQYFKFFYGRKVYESFCHFLSHNPSPLDFNDRPDFSVFAPKAISHPSVILRNYEYETPKFIIYETIIVYKVTIADAADWRDDLQEVFALNSSQPKVHRLVAGETILFDNRSMICLSCSEAYNFSVSVAYYDKDKQMLYTQSLVECTGGNQYLTVDFKNLVQEARFLTHTQVKMDFFPMMPYYGSFIFRLIIADFIVSLKYKDDCRKSSTSFLICSAELPQKAVSYAGIESITWSFNGSLIPDNSDSLASREQSEEKALLYIHARGEYTCSIAVQVYLTFPSRIEIISREASMKIKNICKPTSGRSAMTHMVINSLIVITCIILTGICVIATRIRRKRRKKLEISSALTISPSKLDKKDRNRIRCSLV